MDNEAQAGMLAKEAVNLVTQGMGQQKKMEEKAEKAVTTSAPVKDARAKLEREAYGAAKEAADKAGQYAKDNLIKFVKKAPPTKVGPAYKDQQILDTPVKPEASKTPLGDVLQKASDNIAKNAMDREAIQKGAEAAKDIQKTIRGLADGTVSPDKAGYKLQADAKAVKEGLEKTNGISMKTKSRLRDGMEAPMKAATKASAKGAKTAAKGIKTAAKGAKTAAKGAKAAGLAAAAPVAAPAVVGAAAAGLGAKAAAKGAKAAAKAAPDLRAVGTKALENLMKSGGQGNKEVQPVISAKDVGKEAVKRLAR